MSVKFTSKGLADGTDSTKELEFNVAGVTTGTTRTITVPDENVDLGKMGKVLQVVSVEKTDTWSRAASTTWAGVTGLSASITPRDTNSTIIVLVDVKYGVQDAVENRSQFRVKRDAVVIGGPVMSYYYHYKTAYEHRALHAAQMNRVDSPASASSVTYAVEQNTYSATAATTYVNRTGDSNATSSSRITLMEIGA